MRECDGRDWGAAAVRGVRTLPEDLDCLEPAHSYE